VAGAASGSQRPQDEESTTAINSGDLARLREESAPNGSGPGAEQPPAPDEPDEETPDDADLSAVAARDDEVVVIDEEPLFHLDRCGYLYGKEVIPLPVSEAIDLGFTGCSWCAPVTTLAEQTGADSRR
jgi:hypothetical protein